MFPQGKQQPQMPQFNPLKTLKTLFYISMIVILFTGCFNTGHYVMGTPEAITGAVTRNTAIGEYVQISSFGSALDVSWMHGLIIWPITLLMTALYETTGIVLLTILVTTVTIRGIGTALSLKSTIAMEKMKEIQPKMAAIQAKYAGRTDQGAKQQMGQEIMAMYKKEGINPLGAVGAMFISMPLFISLWRAIQSVAVLQGVEFLGGTMVATAVPFQEVTKNFTSGGWVYLFPLLLMAGAQYMSIMLPSKLSASRNRGTQNAKAAAQAKKTANIMVVVMTFISFSLPVLVIFYWMFGALYTMGQAIIIHKHFTKGGK